MSLLIINAAVREPSAVAHIIQKLTEKTQHTQVVNAEKLKIRPCRGCIACMETTPGICCIQDDYEDLLKMYLEYETVVLISDTSLNFLNHKMLKILERRLPLVTFLVHVEDGDLRHIPRYNKKMKFMLIYTGQADKSLLTTWMDRFAKNIGAVSGGVYHVSEVEEFSV